MLKGRAFFFPFLLSLSLSVSFSSSSDTLTPSQSLTVKQTLISSGQKFELGFFSPGGNNKLYLGIWYYNLPVKTIVWVANRDSPARTTSVSLKLASSGQILISGHTDSVILLLNNQTNAVNPVLQLLDSGNLVFHENDDAGDFIWQSFDYPTDNLLPGQKLGWDKKSGMDRYLTAWRSTTDPSTGNYSFRLDRAGDPEAFMLKEGVTRIYRSGPWVGLRFSGVPETMPSMSLYFTFHDSSDAVYYMFNLVDVDSTIKTRLMVDPTGYLNRFTWVPDRSIWAVIWFAPNDQCDDYMVCGSNSVCKSGNLFVCGCPPGFGPSNLPAWNMRDGSDGCVRRTRLDCGTDGFRVMRDMKLPESGAVVVDDEKSLEECAEACRKDCNCTAYAKRQVVFGYQSGCVMWKGDLRDMKTYDFDGQDLYIRLAAADLGSTISHSSGKTKKLKKVKIIGGSVTVVAAILLIAIVTCFAWKKKHSSTSKSIDDLELPLYDFEAVVIATNNFCIENKLGEGGFGYVYKGVLKEGEEIAIKRLSKESRQGTEEFMNEVKLIAKLQHKNLVRLLGCCLHKEEKMLLYEYLPNRSLDTVLFHKERCFLLDWQRRFNIICGIARGLQYLHHDSRLRIIHRDLKSNNILLDHDMNPKISDFGMARIFGGDETGVNNTRRVVGTYGYMAPEYAMDGVFSIKSDVFSFGVLMLEIITGKKNTKFYDAQSELTLLGYTWKKWKEGNGTELLDSSLGESYFVMEAKRCVQIGLLCVQERAEKRPTMLSVVMWLSSETAALPKPKLPGFCMERKLCGETDSSSAQRDGIFSVNEVTDTMIDGR